MTTDNLVQDIQSSVLGIAVALAVIGPRIAPYLVVLLALLFFMGEVAQGRFAIGRTFSRTAALSGLAFSLFALLSALWAVEFALAAQSAGLVLIIVISALYLVSALQRLFRRMPEARRRRFFRSIPIGAGIGLAFLLVEFATDHAMTIKALQVFPGVIGERGKGLVFADGVVVGVNDIYINRNVAGMVFLAPPLMLTSWLWAPVWLRSYILVFLALAIAISVFASVNETAKLALVSSGLVFVLAWRWPKLVARGLSLCLVLLVLLAVPLGRLPYAVGLHEASWLPHSARARVYIWDYTAEAVFQAPILGVGAQSSRFLDRRIAKPGATPAERQYNRRPGWHTHNIYLQTWFELGAVGALLLLAFALTVLQAVKGLAVEVQPAAYALAATVFVSMGTGWGMWQAWFLGALVIAIIAIAIAAQEFAQRSESVSQV